MRISEYLFSKGDELLLREYGARVTTAIRYCWSYLSLPHRMQRNQLGYWFTSSSLADGQPPSFGATARIL